MLDQFIVANRAEIIGRCRLKSEGRSDVRPVSAVLDRGVPMFLDQLTTELRHGPSVTADIAATAMQHGHDLLVSGYTVSQVVHDYGDVCQSVTELAIERNAVISTNDFRTLNRCLDDAIAGAVTEYGREREQTGTRDAGVGGAQRQRLTRDLQKSIDIAGVAFEAISSGRVGIAGSTGTVLRLGLDTAADLVARLTAEG